MKKSTWLLALILLAQPFTWWLIFTVFQDWAIRKKTDFGFGMVCMITCLGIMIFMAALANYNEENK